MTIETTYEATRKELRTRKRYRRISTMFYRSNAYLHEMRVLALMQEILPFVREQKQVDERLLEALARVHDDTEWIEEFPDDDRIVKPFERRREQRNAIHRLNGRTDFEVLGLKASGLLFHYLDGKGLERELVRYGDVFDGLGESIHEYASGNQIFLKIAQGRREKLLGLQMELTMLNSFSQSAHPFFNPSELPRTLTPYSRQDGIEKLSLQQSCYAPYDFWKHALMTKGDEEVRSSLVQRKELPKHEH